MKKPLIEPSAVRDLFRYMEGRLYFMAYRRDKPAGAMGREYWCITINRRRYFAHRLVWAYFNGAWPEHEIDHIDGDKLNNRIENLRDVPRRTNKQNTRRANRGNAGLLGTHLFRNGRWKASINVDGKNKHLGYFDTTQQAHIAYLEAKRLHHPGGTL